MALQSKYPHVRTQLIHANPFQLLIATILSAQCTDKQVNAVTPSLFASLKTPQDFITIPLSQLEDFIHSTGFYHNKAKNIQQCCNMLLDKFNGKVPQSLEELIQLPGVGRKTANVVLSTAFGKHCIVVDTHVKRISNRLGLTQNKDPVKIEFDLMKVIPKKAWNDFSLQLIFLGREYCLARKPKCEECFLLNWCFKQNVS